MLSLTSSPFSNLIKLFLETPVERAKSSRVKPRAFRCPLILSQKIAGNTLVLGSAGLSFIVKVSLRLLSASSLLTSSLRNYRSLNISYLGDTFVSYEIFRYWDRTQPVERKGRIIQPARATANVLEAYLVQRARLLGGSPKEIARAQGWRVKKHGAPDRYSWVTRDNLIQVIWEEGAA